jgi:hypothetical protein
MAGQDKFVFAKLMLRTIAFVDVPCLGCIIKQTKLRVNPLRTEFAAAVTKNFYPAAAAQLIHASVAAHRAKLHLFFNWSQNPGLAIELTNVWH